MNNYVPTFIKTGHNNTKILIKNIAIFYLTVYLDDL